eukprot:12332858-Alexandrium_andersonii.AAC.1
MLRGGRLRRRASRGASGAQICNKEGSSCLQIPSRGEDRVARWASWVCDLPWRVGGKISTFD